MSPKNLIPDEFARHTLIHLFGQGRLDEALALSQQMIEIHPKYSLGWKVKGAIELRRHEFDNAVKSVQKAIALAPKDWELFNSLGLAFKGLGKIKNAEAAYKQSIQLNPQYPSVYSNLGALLRDAGDNKGALNCYKKKVELTPDDEEAKYHVAALAGQLVAAAPTTYVKNLFDQYAESFDQHLVGSLKYQTPEKIAALFRKHKQTPTDARITIYDLGCGTGLMADALSELSADWFGIDLSEKMLKQAMDKGRYKQVFCGDLTTEMQAVNNASVDVVFAADVFVYIGDLAGVFASVQKALKSGGEFIFSTEELRNTNTDESTPTDYLLLPSGRYAHSAAYIETACKAAGLRVTDLLGTEIREERHQPIHGLIVRCTNT
ncbi:MAG: tetratricopeptide repeat protein [Aquabacterium sp.]